MKVREIMGKPHAVPPETSVKEAARLMAELDIATVFVVQDKKVMGILTDMDIIRRFVSSDKLSKNVLVKDIMTSRIITVDSDENVEDAVHIMKKNGVRRLPVVSKGRFIGLITTDYISAHAAELGVDALFG